MGCGSLLVWDSFRAHTTPAVEKELKDLQIESVIPGGCTSKAPPLDVSLNKPFKGILRKCWVDYISGEVGQAEGNERINTAPKQIVVDWVVRTWTYLKQREDLIQKSFLVTGISCATDGSEDHLCYDHIPLQAAR